MKMMTMKIFSLFFAGLLAETANANFQCDYSYPDSESGKRVDTVVRVENLRGTESLVIRRPGTQPGYNDGMVYAYAVVSSSPGELLAVSEDLWVKVIYPRTGLGPGTIAAGVKHGTSIVYDTRESLRNCRPWQPGLNGKYRAL